MGGHGKRFCAVDDGWIPWLISGLSEAVWGKVELSFALISMKESELFIKPNITSPVHCGLLSAQWDWYLCPKPKTLASIQTQVQWWLWVYFWRKSFLNIPTFWFREIELRFSISQLCLFITIGEWEQNVRFKRTLGFCDVCVRRKHLLRFFCCVGVTVFSLLDVCMFDNGDTWQNIINSKSKLRRDVV